MYTIYEEHIQLIEEENEKLHQQLVFYQQLLEYKTLGPPIHSQDHPYHATK